MFYTTRTRRRPTVHRTVGLPQASLAPSCSSLPTYLLHKKHPPPYWAKDVFGGEGETPDRKHSRLARLVRFAILLVFSPHRLASSSTGRASALRPTPVPGAVVLVSLNTNRRPIGRLLVFGGEGETRTPAPVTRPTPLAGAPRHQLEYFSIGSVLLLLLKNGGESGIRTHGTLPYDGFQDRSVMTTSVSLRIGLNYIITFNFSCQPLFYKYFVR